MRKFELVGTAGCDDYGSFCRSVSKTTVGLTMAQQPRSAMIRYGAAFLAVILATLLRGLFNPILEGAGFAFFFVAVVIAAWYGGLGPSLLAVTLSVASSAIFFPDPPPKEGERALRVFVGLGTFFFIGVATAILSESMRAAQRRAEAQAEEAIAQREQMRRAEFALREADRRKDEFLAILAHELRNPLAPICTALEILRTPGADASANQLAKAVIERQVHQLVRLVDDLLDVSRIMRGKIELRPELVDLGSVFARAVETAQPIIESQRHELTVSLPPEPIKLTADPIRLAQVINNLLTNAAKYTEPGGRIWLSGEQDGNQVTIRVRDTGIGIPTEMLPQVFQLFTQVDSSVTRSQGGLGIGLTLVKSLIELTGGSVEAKSDGLGKGSEFVIHLPTTWVGKSSVTLPTFIAPPVELSTQYEILVVDDNADAAETLTTLLRFGGHEVHVVYDGPAALDWVQHHRPDIVFLDIGMPHMDGLEVARRIRSNFEMGNPVLVAVTGWGSEDDRRRTQEAGFNFHLVKPVTQELISQVLSELNRGSDSETNPSSEAENPNQVQIEP